MRLSELSIRRPVFAMVLSALLVIVGLVSMSRLAVRELPDIDPPVVSVQATYRGASAQVVENKVTQVIEDRIAGVEGIDKLKSTSRDERSSINIEFSLDRNVEEAVNDIRDRISRVVSQLPTEVDPPEVAKSEANAEPVMYLNLESESMNTLELTDFAERNLKDRLSAAPGVSLVELNGARRYAMRIWIDRVALAARGLTVVDIESALRRENVQAPAGRLEGLQRLLGLQQPVIRLPRSLVRCLHYFGRLFVLVDLLLLAPSPGHLQYRRPMHRQRNCRCLFLLHYTFVH